jgi:hypothetical protein
MRCSNINIAASQTKSLIFIALLLYKIELNPFVPLRSTLTHCASLHSFRGAPQNSRTFQNFTEKNKNID